MVIRCNQLPNASYLFVPPKQIATLSNCWKFLNSIKSGSYNLKFQIVPFEFYLPSLNRNIQMAKSKNLDVPDLTGRGKNDRNWIISSQIPLYRDAVQRLNVSGYN